MTALTAEPPELGEEGIFEIFKFKEEVSSMKKRSTQTPTLQIPEEYILEKFEEDPLTLARVDALVDGNAESDGRRVPRAPCTNGDTGRAGRGYARAKGFAGGWVVTGDGFWF